MYHRHAKNLQITRAKFCHLCKIDVALVHRRIYEFLRKNNDDDIGRMVKTHVLRIDQESHVTCTFQYRNKRFFMGFKPAVIKSISSHHIFWFCVLTTMEFYCLVFLISKDELSSSVTFAVIAPIDGDDDDKNGCCEMRNEVSAV